MLSPFNRAKLILIFSIYDISTLWQINITNDKVNRKKCGAGRFFDGIFSLVLY